MKDISKLTLITLTLSPAKNGARMFFEGDHTFFGEVVNIAETLQTICWYKVIDESLCKSCFNMSPLKQQKMDIFSQAIYKHKHMTPLATKNTSLDLKMDRPNNKNN